MRQYLNNKVITALMYEVDKLEDIQNEEDWQKARKRLSQRLTRMKSKGVHSTDYLACRLALAVLIYKKDLNL